MTVITFIWLFHFLPILNLIDNKSAKLGDEGLPSANTAVSINELPALSKIFRRHRERVLLLHGKILLT